MKQTIKKVVGLALFWGLALLSIQKRNPAMLCIVPFAAYFTYVFLNKSAYQNYCKRQKQHIADYQKTFGRWYLLADYMGVSIFLLMTGLALVWRTETAMVLWVIALFLAGFWPLILGRIMKKKKKESIP